MQKTFVVTVVTTFLLVAATAHAGRLKVYSFPKQIAAGQLATIVFENPEPEHPISRNKCTAEKLIAWVKSDVPILRIEQKGKQVFTSFGSYLSENDSVIATYMVPVSLEPGEATLYLLNDHDASVPYKFTVAPTMQCKLKRVAAGYISPLGKITVIGEGFMPAEILDPTNAIKELQMNVGYDKMSLPEQWTTLHRRMANDWARVAMGDFLQVEQGGKKWELFVEGCGLLKEGMTLDFIAPPDLKPGPASLSMVLRRDKIAAATSEPITVTVQ
ncbi:MAG: hypothetical protein Q8916_14420 [Bacteroidota bacterium]|nr:hypothetical protein [Bacteroidota bacterium]MDP4231590.1 hypothetical protein [Bacteroidota bacterium]MDP4236498.1 hypothetical protein [Bacteroidota bacterium]